MIIKGLDLGYVYTKENKNDKQREGMTANLYKNIDDIKDTNAIVIDLKGELKVNV